MSLWILTVKPYVDMMYSLESSRFQLYFVDPISLYYKMKDQRSDSFAGVMYCGSGFSVLSDGGLAECLLA